MKSRFLHGPLTAILLCCATTGQAKEEQWKTHEAKPLHFIANAGQVIDQSFRSRTDIDCKLSAGPGLNIFIGAGKIEYQWGKEVRTEEAVADSKDPDAMIDPMDPETTSYELYRMDMTLIGGNPNARVIKEGQQPYYERFFQPWVNRDNSNHGVKAHAFTKITYKDIYPDIDWVFYFNAQGQLEHDFVIHPGGKVSAIQMRYSGAVTLGLNPDGSLMAITPMGTLKEHAPVAFAKVPNALAGSAPQSVSASFRLQDEGILSFDIGAYTGTLVIDPVLEWGTYFGGSGNDEALAITGDRWGAVYMVGSTVSLDNMATTGAHQATLGGGTNDAFMSKWDASGQLLWSGYYGGSGEDLAKGVICDALGNVYIGGSTQSTSGIATANAIQGTLNGGSVDAFLLKMDSSGQRQWGTYFGGSGIEAQPYAALATDANNNVYLTSTSTSRDLLTTPGVHQTASSLGTDVFLAKFKSDGSLVWNTLYGGTATNNVRGIAVDKDFNVYLTGATQSTTGIATAGAHQPANAGGYDAYLAKFTREAKLSWATYLGGTAAEVSNAVSVSGDYVVIGGGSTSTAGISTTNSYQPVKDASQDAFLSLFKTDGSLIWSTYYGGDKVDEIKSVHMRDNSVYLFGETTSTTNMSSPGSIQENLGGLADVFIAKFDLQGQRTWASYYGGAGADKPNSMFLSDDLKIYFGGKTQSATGIAYNAYQSVLKSGQDAFLVRINDCDAPGLPLFNLGDSMACAGTSITYRLQPDSLAAVYTWLLPETWQGSSDSNSIQFKAGDADGIIRVYAQSACGSSSDTALFPVRILALPEPVIIRNKKILSTDKAYASYQWIRDGVDIDGATSGTYLVDKNGDYSLRVKNEDSCEGLSDTVQVDEVRIAEHQPALALRLFPNPADATVTIQTADEGVLTVWSIDGRELLQSVPVQAGRTQVVLATLPAGVYVLRLTTDRGCTYGKLIHR